MALDGTRLKNGNSTKMETTRKAGKKGRPKKTETYVQEAFHEQGIYLENRQKGSQRPALMETAF